ncbi:MAG: efflux transporter outer membrane subunit [Deltaproteobacteria bacterium]|nr:efflux transporter outer membrane subunit [Deltaproteobacteria bacterium]
MPYLVDQTPSSWKVSRFLVIWIIGLILLTTGCAVGPDFRKPQPAVPAAYSGLGPVAASQTGKTTSQPAQLVEWWKIFNDPTLTSLVGRAIESNLDLRQATSRIRQARAMRGMAASGLWPAINVGASYTRSQGSESTGGGGLSSGSGSVQNLFQTGLDAAWELDIFGGTRRGVEAAQADVQTAVEDRRDILVSLIAEVGTDYVGLRGYQQQIIVNQKNLTAQKHTAEITRKRYEAGFVTGLDVANAAAQAATTESLIPVLESLAQGTIYNLSVLLGREPAALAEELSGEKPLPTTPPEVPVGLPSDLLRRRPDIRRAEAVIHATTARIGVATADLFPKFSLTGSFGLMSSTFSPLGNWSSRFWSYGPSVTWPIFDAGRIRWNIEVQNAVQEQALLAYEKAVLTALKDVETALVAYTKEQQHLRLLTEAVRNNSKAVELSRKLYVAGKTDFLNVLNAERSLNASEDAQVQSTRALSTNLIALYKALGGGWESAQ